MLGRCDSVKVIKDDVHGILCPFATTGEQVRIESDLHAFLVDIDDSTVHECGVLTLHTQAKVALSFKCGLINSHWCVVKKKVEAKCEWAIRCVVGEREDAILICDYVSVSHMGPIDLNSLESGQLTVVTRVDCKVYEAKN